MESVRPEMRPWPQPNFGAAAVTPYLQRWEGPRRLALHTLLVAVCLVLYVLGSPSGTLIASGLVVAGVFFWFVWLEAKSTVLKITPVSVYFLWQGFALGVAAVYMGLEIYDGSSIYLGKHNISPEYIAKGYIIGLIGTLPLHAGLQWLRPKVDSRRELTPVLVKRLLPQLIFFWVLGIVVLALNRQLVFAGTLVTVFQFAAHGALAVFILIPPEKLRMPESVRFGILVTGTFVLLLAATRSSSKLYLMQALVGLFFYVLQRKHLHRHIPVAAVFLIFIYLTVVAPTVNEARSIEFHDRVSHTQAQIEAFKKNSPLYTGKVELEFYQHQIERLLGRQFEASSIGLIVGEVETKGYAYWESFEFLKYYFIPRLIWPDKPYMVRGAWFTHYLGLSAREADSTVAIGMEAAGELYWSFGVIGVLVGMFILGMLFAGVWRLAGADPGTDPIRMALYMLNALTMMNIPEAASRIASCLTLLLIFGVLFAVLRPHRESTKMVFRRPQFLGST